MRNELAAFFCAEDAVNTIGNEGVRHGEKNNIAVNRPYGTSCFLSRFPGIPLRSVPG